MNRSDSIVVSQVCDATLETVWKAITDPSEMRYWFFGSIDQFEPRVGFETQFNVRAEGRDFLHLWKVIEVKDRSLIAYRWRYEGFEGDSVVTWDLSRQDNATIVTLTHSGQESFRGDPLFSRESCAAGWKYFVQERLPNHLNATSSNG